MTDYGSVAMYDVPFAALEGAILGWVSEALDLRHGVAGDPKGRIGTVRIEDGLREILDLLLRVRVRSDRVDELLAKVTQAKGRAKRAQDGAQFAADVAYDEATRGNAARRTIEFSTGRERHADAALDSLEVRRTAHQAARLVSVTTEAYEVVNQVHWQLEGIRKDLRASLHAFQFESSLER